MCANALNTNLASSERHAEEQSSINEKGQDKLDHPKKNMCILSKKITRSQNKNAVITRSSLCIKSNEKFSLKECGASTIPKFVISCRFCKKSFRRVEHCQNHECIIPKSQSLSNESVKYRCHLCLKLFKKKSTLDKHLKSCNCNNCNHCDAHFTIHKELCEHLQNVHNLIDHEKFYICPLCNKSFCKNDSLNKHMMTHKNHVCELCNVTFTTNKLLKKHQQNMHDVKVTKKHQCEICEKRFNRPLHLTVHKRVHTGEKPLKCLDCNKNYYCNKTFTKHLKTVRHLKKVSIDNEIIVEKKYACDKCEAKFFNLQGLQRHMQFIHSTEDLLKCNHCTYSTKCKGNLKRHLEVHAETKRFACELCGQTFRSLGSLKDHHAFIHSDKRDFLCNLCNKTFKINGDLQRHKKTHSDDKPYKCSCTSSFKRLSHLKRHMSSSKHVGMFHKYAQMEDLSKNMLEDVLESCDDPMQFSNTNNSKNENLFSESEIISSSDIPTENGKSLLHSNDLYLCYNDNDKSSETTVLHPLSKTIEQSVVALTDAVSTKNITITQLSNVFENPIITLEDINSTGSISLSHSVVNWAWEIPSQATTIPLISTMISPTVMALTNSMPSKSTGQTVLTAVVEKPLINLSENNISLLPLPSVVKEPNSNIPSNDTSMIKMATSIEQSALNVINNNLPVEVTANVVQEDTLISNETTHQSESQTLPHKSFESRSTNLDINKLNNFETFDVLNAANYIQSPILQLPNVSSIVVPKSTIRESCSPLPTYSFITQNFDFGHQLSVNDNDLLCSIPKYKNLVSAESSNIEQKSFSGDVLEQANVLVPLSSNISNTFCIPDFSSQPVNLPLNTNFVDENFNQLSPFNNVMGSPNNSVENSVPNYPVTVNNLIFSNETLLNSLLNLPIYNTGFESPL